MALTNEDILKSFQKTGGVLKGHFVLTSGRHADTYMQCAKLFVDTEESERLCKALSEKLMPFKADCIVSPAVGGIILGYEVARQLRVKNYFTERQDGLMTLRRGFELEKGARVIITEDVVTTGGSVFEVIELVKSLGAVPVAVASIVDRSNGKVAFPVPFVNLLSMEVASFTPEECPLCKEGLPIVKPGSRSLK